MYSTNSAMPETHRTRTSRTRVLGGLVTLTTLTALAALTPISGAAAASSYTFDTGSGLVFTIQASNGNMTSLKHNGVELTAKGNATAQFEAGFPSATVTAKTFDAGKSELISATHGDVTQYYFARKGDNTIYLATKINKVLNPGEARLILRVSSALMPQSPVAAKTVGTTTTVEGGDVFKFPNGHTASKFYSSQRLIAQQPYGASGPAHGVFIIPGRQEMTSGGPFFRDIEVNDASAATNITEYMFSGHAQTEPMRIGLHGPYAVAVTNGAKPVAMNLDFLSAYIPGLLSVAQRGTVTGTASGVFGSLPMTAALAGPNGQYWAAVQNGKFSIGKIRPGSYTATLYAGELAIGATRTVTVTAGHTTSLALTGNVPANGTLFQVGTFDGSPVGFLNADKIETMHPSDVRMSPWKVATFKAGSAVSGFPMAAFKNQNTPVNVSFQLKSVPSKGAVLRLATTLAFGGGRPKITVGNWTSPNAVSGYAHEVGSRAITRGTWRGFNQTYTFTIPKSALKTGTNTLSIVVLSGNVGVTYLSPSFVFDALALDPA